MCRKRHVICSNFSCVLFFFALMLSILNTNEYGFYFQTPSHEQQQHEKDNSEKNNIIISNENLNLSLLAYSLNLVNSKRGELFVYASFSSFVYTTFITTTLQQRRRILLLYCQKLFLTHQQHHYVYFEKAPNSFAM